MRPGDKQARVRILKSPDEDTPLVLSYKPVSKYAHQSAQGTGLLDEKLKGRFPDIATIPQSIIPGAFTGSRPLEASPQEAILLLFLVVGCSMFHLRPKRQNSKLQYCVVMPDVTNLLAFSRCLPELLTLAPPKGENQFL